MQRSRASSKTTDQITAGAESMVSEIVARLVPVLRPVQIWLFGSRARGEGTADSDYDIAVLTDEPADQCLALEMRAIDALWGVDAAIDVCVWPAASFAAQAQVVASLPATVRREGRVLYER